MRAVEKTQAAVTGKLSRGECEVSGGPMARKKRPCRPGQEKLPAPYNQVEDVQNQERSHLGGGKQKGWIRGGFPPAFSTGGNPPVRPFAIPFYLGKAMILGFIRPSMGQIETVVRSPQ